MSRLRSFIVGLALCLGSPGAANPTRAMAGATDRDAANLASMDISSGRSEEAGGAYAKAEHHFRQAFRRLIPIHGADHPLMAELYSDLAHVLDLQGREGEAEPLHRRALAIALASGGERSATAALYFGGIASNLDRQGDHAEAEEFHRKALATDIALFGVQSEAAGIATSHLAANLLLQERTSEAISLFEAAVRSFALVEGGDRLNLMWGRQGLAIALDHAGRHAEAEPLHREALRNGLDQLGERHPDIAPLYRHLAENLLAQGRVDEPRALFRRHLEITERLSQARSAPLAASLASFAIHIARDKPSRREALMLARKAVAIARSRHARDHSSKTFGRRAAVDERARARALTGFGKPQPQWRHDAFEALLIAAWLHAGDAPEERDRLRDAAFRAAQDLGATASGLAIAAAETRQAAAGGPLAELVGDQQRLAAELRELDSRLLHALAAGEGAKAEALRGEAEAVADALAGIETTLHKRFPAYADLVSPRSVGIAEVQKRLGANEAVLLIIPADDDVFSFAVSRDSASWHRSVGGARDVAARVGRLRCQVDPVTCAASEADDAVSPFEALGYQGFDHGAAFGLYKDLIGPLAETLGDADRLYVTVSGPLADLPLALLLTSPLGPEQDGADPAVLLAARWLAEAYAIIRLPTVSAFRAVKLVERHGTAGTPFVGYGAPRLADVAPTARGGRSGALLALARSDAMARGLPTADVDLLRTLPSLPGTERELHAMSGVLEASAGALYLGAAATEASARSNPALGNARVVAFATHGLLPNDLAGLKEPGLVFTPPAAPSAQDDGVLTASEASGLALNAEWVILSACNTASPVGTPGSASLSSLARAFLYAGTRALLASHWRVADDATAALTVETLAAARANPGLTRAQAFQRAQRAVRTGRRADGSPMAQWNDAWTHPSAWGRRCR
jgi:CHAT domain-containing protein